MKLWLIPAAVLLLGSCTGGQIGLPPISLSGNSVKLMTDARTPMEAYVNAHGRLTRLHLNARKSLEDMPSNYFGASDSLRRIIAQLELMKKLTQEPAGTGLETYIARYRSMLHAAEKKRAAGALISDLRRYGREVKIKFAPSAVAILAKFPRDESAAQAGSNDDSLPPPPDEPTLPPPKLPAPKKDPAPKEGTVPFWILYKSWVSVQDDLASAYRGKKETAAAYRRAVDLLTRMAASVGKERRNTLDLCAKMYAKAHEKTRGFTSLPGGIRAEDILSELNTIAGIVREGYDPDRK